MNDIRNYGFITIVLLLLLTLSCASSSEATDDLSNARANVNIPETLKKADELFEQREDLAKLREAIKTLAEARHADNRSYEVEWTFAKYNYFLGKQGETEKEIDAAFKTGEKAAQIAMRMESEKPEGYFWFAANLGEAAKRSPMTVGLKRVDEIRDAMQKVIQLQPDYQGASAFDGLARIEPETGLIGGKTEKAIEYLEKGLELEKNNSNLRLNLAKAYLRVDRNSEAKKQLEYITKMEPDKDYKFEYETNVKEAKRLLESRF
jgi:tetratricopeptide (TPR) repeat protein